MSQSDQWNYQDGGNKEVNDFFFLDLGREIFLVERKRIVLPYLCAPQSASKLNLNTNNNLVLLR